MSKKLEDLVANQKITMIKTMTIKDRVEQDIKITLEGSQFDLDEAERTIIDKRRGHAMLVAKAELVRSILDGNAGFLMVLQGSFEIKDEFTAFEEIASNFKRWSFNVSLEMPIRIPVGYEVYFIANNGMMKFVDANRDTSD